MTLAEQVRLTTTAKAAGCAAKLSPSVLDAVLKRLPPQVDPNVIVGFETSDDAAVYRLTDDLAASKPAMMQPYIASRMIWRSCRPWIFSRLSWMIRNFSAR
jgi:selenophosphate synthase